MINPLLKGRKTAKNEMYCWTSQFLRDKKGEKLCFLTVRPVGCDAQSHLSVGVKLLLGSPFSSNGSRNVCSCACVRVCLCVCVRACVWWGGNECVFTSKGSPSLYFRSPYEKT